MRRLLACLLAVVSLTVAGLAPARAATVYYLAALPEAEVRPLAEDPGRFAHTLFAHGEGRLSLDAAWGGLRWLIARGGGSASASATRLMAGGSDLSAPLGLSRARLHTPAEVRRIAAVLAGLSEDDLRRRYDARAMDAARVVPDDWLAAEREGDSGLERLIDALRELRAFYAQAARDGLAVVCAAG